MPIPSVSERGRSTPPSPIRKLATYADAAKAQGIRVYHLNIGQPDIPTPPEFFRAVRTFDEKVLEYCPSQGILEFRKKLVAYYHGYGFRDVRLEHLMVTTGGSEGVMFSMMAAASPGEEIITFEPFYPNYAGFAAMAGIRLIPVSTDPQTGYHLPARASIEAKITAKTRALLICSPNNPTGAIYDRNEMEMIRDLALERNLFVLSDEVYREFTFEGQHTGILSFPELSSHAILIDSLSKRYSACGARIGCVVSKNASVMETFLKFGQARLSPPTLEQVGSSLVVESGERYFKGMIDEYRKRRDVLYEELMKIPGVSGIKPQGAFYMMVGFPVKDIEHFCQWLLTDFHVDRETTMMAPGPGFYATPGKGVREARIAYVLNTDDIRKAVSILKLGLVEYSK